MQENDFYFYSAAVFGFVIGALLMGSVIVSYFILLPKNDLPGRVFQNNNAIYQVMPKQAWPKQAWPKQENRP